MTAPDPYTQGYLDGSNSTNHDWQMALSEYLPERMGFEPSPFEVADYLRASLELVAILMRRETDGDK